MLYLKYTYNCKCTQAEVLIYLYVSQKFYDCVTSCVIVNIPNDKYKYNCKYLYTKRIMKTILKICLNLFLITEK